MPTDTHDPVSGEEMNPGLALPETATCCARARRRDVALTSRGISSGARR